MAVGTGLPIKREYAEAQPTPVAGVLHIASSAGAWGQIAKAGEELARAGEHALYQSQVGYLAEQDVAITRKQTELRNQHAFDPPGFDAAWKGFTEGTISEAPSWAVPKMKIALGRTGNAAYSGILNETRARDFRLDGERVASLAVLRGNDVVGAAMAGTLVPNGPDGEIRDPRILEYRSVLQSAVTAGLHTQEWADLHMDDITSKAQGETAAREGVQIYRDKGYDAAVEHLTKSIKENESLSMKAEKRHAAFSRGMQAVNLQRRQDAQDRVGIVQAAGDMVKGIEAGDDPGEGSVRDMLSAAESVGAAAAHRRLSVAYAVQQQTRGRTLPELAGAAAGARQNLAGQRAAVPPGYTPEQQVALRGTANAARPGPVWGDPNSPDFERNHLVTITLNSGKQFTVNKVGAESFRGFLNEVEGSGYKLDTVHGYSRRKIFGTDIDSQHKFGNAIDVNPGRNPVTYGEVRTDFPAVIGGIAAKWGISWGGDWKNKKDAMHFEFAGVEPKDKPVRTAQVGGGASDAAPAGPAPGLVEPGNIDLTNRPQVRTPEGKIATVQSRSFNLDGKEVLIPTVSDDGRLLTDDQAVEQYKRTGKHLGKFDTPDNATAYGKRLSSAQGQFYGQSDDRYAGSIYKGVQDALIKSARSTWPRMQTAVSRGDPIDDEDFQAVQAAAAGSGDAKWMQDVAALGVARQITALGADLPIAEREALRTRMLAELPQSGLPAAAQTYVRDAVDKHIDRQNKMVRENPVRYHVEHAGAPPDPLDFANPQALQAGMAQRVAIARGVAADQRVPAGSPLQEPERAAFAGAIAGGDPKRAAAALDALAGLPDEMLTPAIGHADIKGAISGALRSSDPARYSAAMGFLDRMWTRAPETADNLFGTDAIHALKTFQANQRFMTPETLAKEREKAALDPQVRARIKENEQDGLKEARKFKADDVVKQFDTSWWITPGPLARALGSQPSVPVDGLTRNTMMGDWETQFARLYAENGGDKAQAAKDATELLKTKWTASPVNGGKLMLNAPETLRDRNGNLIYPPIGGSHDWMKRQVEAAIEHERNPTPPGEMPPTRPNYAVMGSPGLEMVAPELAVTDQPRPAPAWTLVADRRTASEAQAGQPASYQIVVQNADGRWDVLPRRFAFDPGPDLRQARTDFDAQRKRVLEYQDAVAAMGINTGGY